MFCFFFFFFCCIGFYSKVVPSTDITLWSITPLPCRIPGYSSISNCNIFFWLLRVMWAFVLHVPFFKASI
uniref:Uncharacterized protein n=1 Tax=Rhipicephalus microplus TaxID=6941 RepID=A0A6M2DBQ5_RHIMP